MCRMSDHNADINDGVFLCELIYADWDQRVGKMHVDIDRNGTVLFY